MAPFYKIKVLLDPAGVKGGWAVALSKEKAWGFLLCDYWALRDRRAVWIGRVLVTVKKRDSALGWARRIIRVKRCLVLSCQVTL